MWQTLPHTQTDRQTVKRKSYNSSFRFFLSIKCNVTNRNSFFFYTQTFLHSSDRQTDQQSVFYANFSSFFLLAVIKVNIKTSISCIAYVYKFVAEFPLSMRNMANSILTHTHTPLSYITLLVFPHLTLLSLMFLNMFVSSFSFTVQSVVNICYNIMYVCMGERMWVYFVRSRCNLHIVRVQQKKDNE